MTSSQQRDDSVVPSSGRLRIIAARLAQLPARAPRPLQHASVLVGLDKAWLDWFFAIQSFNGLTIQRSKANIRYDA